MERHEFLAKFGISMAAVCAGCSLIGCGSKGNDPSPGGGTPPPAPGSGNVFSVNLDTDLQSVGSSKISNGIILVRLAAGVAASAFTAVQVACTHEGTSINYNTNQGIFICPNHGSEFNTSGGVVLWPATSARRNYNQNVAGSTVKVKA
jgi:cytochrome b6-f complex iron-sulfur subunit